jgi:hypothetical protein
VVRQNQEEENWDEYVIYNKLITEQIARFPKYTLRNHGRSIAALLRVSIETVNTQGPLKEKEGQATGYSLQSSIEEEEWILYCIDHHWRTY